MGAFGTLVARFGCVAVLLGLQMAAATAAESVAADELVIVLQPANAAPSTRRPLLRIGDELAADGYRVVVTDVSASIGPGSMLESVRGEPGKSFVIALFGDPSNGQSELWVVARTGRRLAARRAAVLAEDPDRMPDLLSARALELVRATSLELSFGGESSTNVRPSDLQPPARSPPMTPVESGSAGPEPARTATLDLDVGLALLHSFAGPPPGIMPIGRGRLRFGRFLYARLTLAGLGTRPRIENEYGWAIVTQNLGLIELGATFRSDKRIRPGVGVGAGLLNVSVVGAGNSPYEGRDQARWSPAFSGGLGLAFALGSRVALTTELHALIAVPPSAVRFVGMNIATVGFPSLLVTMGIQVAP